MPDTANIAATLLNAEKRVVETAASKAAQGGARKLANGALINQGSGLGSRALGGANSTMWKIRNWTWYAAAAAAALNWVAAKTPVGKGAAAKAASWLGKPEALLNTTTLSDLSRTGSTVLKGAGDFATARGAGKVGKRLADAAAKTGKIEGDIAATVFRKADGAFAAVSGFLKDNAVFQWAVKRKETGAVDTVLAASQTIGKKSDALYKIAAGLQEQEFGDLAKIGKRLEAAVTTHNPRKVLDEVQKLSSRAGGLGFGGEASEEAVKAAGGFAKELHKSVGKTLFKTENAAAKADMWKNIPTSIRNGAGAISKMSATELLQAGTMLAGTTMSTMSMASNNAMQSRALKDMKEKLGEESVEYQAARKAKRRELLPKLGAQTASWITTIMQMMGKGSTVMFLGNTGLNMLANSISAFTGPNPLQAWAHLSDGVNRGEATMQDYAHFLTAGPIEETRGVPMDNGNLQMLAEYYREQGATPQELVAEARAGRLNETALAIKRGETPEPMQVRAAPPAPGGHAARELERRTMSKTGKALLIGGGLAAAGIGAAAASPELRQKMTKLFTDNISKATSRVDAINLGRAASAAAGQTVGV